MVTPSDPTHFRYVREVSRSPGVTVIETRRRDGLRCLAQAISIKAPALPRGKSEALSLQVARELEERADVVHRSIFTRTDGGPTLLWMTRWEDSWKPARDTVLSPEQVASLGVTLLRWLQERHLRERVHPTLGQGTLLLRARVEAQVFGVPLAFDGRAYTSPTRPAKRAPWEFFGDAFTARGDLWRLVLLLRSSMGAAQDTIRGARLALGLQRVMSWLESEDGQRHPKPAARVLEVLTPSAQGPWKIYAPRSARPAANPPAPLAVSRSHHRAAPAQ